MRSYLELFSSFPLDQSLAFLSVSIVLSSWKFIQIIDNKKENLKSNRGEAMEESQINSYFYQLSNFIRFHQLPCISRMSNILERFCSILSILFLKYLLTPRMLLKKNQCIRLTMKLIFLRSITTKKKSVNLSSTHNLDKDDYKEDMDRIWFKEIEIEVGI